MKKIFTCCLVLLVFAAKAQKHTYIYFVAFKDKNNSAFSVKKPQEFLSEKALQRRAKYQIKIEESDLPVNQNYINTICNKRVKFKSASKWLNGILIEITDTDVIQDIAKRDFVAATAQVAYYDFLKKPGAEVNEEPPTYSNPLPNNGDVQNIYGEGFDQIKMLQGIMLHQMHYNGEGITIGVLDAGFLNGNKLPWFARLRQNNQIVVCKDFVDNDSYVFDGNPHGLEVLSCMATGDTGTFIGTAPRAKYLLLRSEDAETEQLVEEINWAVAAEYADSAGVDLITSSLGYNLYDDNKMSHTYAHLDGNTAYVTRAAEMAFSKGIVVVCSAGNEGGNPWRHIGFPADAKHAITVGAVDNNRHIAYFSSQGPTTDGHIKPDVSAMGVSATVESPFDDVTHSDGTSFSAPITAGMVACLMQAHPLSTPQQIADAVRQSGDRAEIADTIYGNGIPDFYLAHLILGDSTFNAKNDQLINVTYSGDDKLLSFTIYSATTQIMGFKIIDENGNILKTGTQQCIGKKFHHFYIDELELPKASKGYGFVLENDAHQTFIRLF